MRSPWWFITGGAALTCAALFFWASTPQRIDGAAIPAHQPDLQNGEVLFHAGGCISCHGPAKGATGRDPALPSGGAPLETPLGVLYPPNITADQETGIGTWSDADFVNALKRGVSPDGRNYIPAFPYTSYRHMTVADLLDLKAYLFSLTPVHAENPPVGLPLPWLTRRGIGVWKRLALTGTATEETSFLDPKRTPTWNRGAYLVNGPGHCAECHTPRDLLMIPETALAFTGGPHPSGKGKVPSLHGLIRRGDFTDVNDIATALKEGEDGGYDNLTYGGMKDVQHNIAQLPDADIRAIATYLSTLK